MKKCNECNCDMIDYFLTPKTLSYDGVFCILIFCFFTILILQLLKKNDILSSNI